MNVGTRIFDANFEKYVRKPDWSEDGMKAISYSQMTMFNSCQRQWGLRYIDGHKPPDYSIHSTFGTSMHEVVQHWLEVMYTDSIKASNELDLMGLLMTRIRVNYLEGIEKNGGHFSNSTELAEFLNRGVAALSELKRRRKEFYDVKNEKLIAIELPIFHPIQQIGVDRPLYFNGFIDALIYDTSNDLYIIDDLKTSMRGWSSYAKSDLAKLAQTTIYRKFLSEQYHIPFEKIRSRFLILRGEVETSSGWNMKFVQEFIPPQTKKLQEFSDLLISDILTKGIGSGKAGTDFFPNPGNGARNCKFCKFVDNDELCPKNTRFQ